MELIRAFRKNEEFLRDVATAKTRPDHLHIWWLGQSGFLVQWETTYLLIDPYLSDSLTEKYANTEKPHVRMSERVIAPESLDFIDVVTSSHNHTDHLDKLTLVPIIQANPEIALVIPETNREFVCERLELDNTFPRGLNDGEAISLKGIAVTGIPAAHEEVERDDAGRCRFMGYIFQLGPWSLYHSGDTLWYKGMVDQIRPFQVDVAMLPINGRDPKRKVAGNLSCVQAARLGIAIQADLVIPCHYNMFDFNTADPRDFKQEAKEMGQTVRILAHGERLSLRK